MNTIEAQEFLRDKGIDIDNYLIHDTTGSYRGPIPLVAWMIQFISRYRKNAISKEQEYRLAHFGHIQYRHAKIKEIVKQRKTSFTLQEWIFLKETLNISE